MRLPIRIGTGKSGGGSFTPLANTKLFLKLENNANDSSGLGNNGTWTGTPGYNTGKVGSCGDFIGNNFIAIPSVISGNGPATFLTWVKTTQNQAELIIKRVSSLGPGIFTFILSGGKLNFWDYAGGFGFSPGTVGNTAVNDGNWHLVGFVRNGTSGKYYVDGVPDGVTTAASAISWNTENMYIGRSPQDSLYYIGLEDEIIIEDIAWTDQMMLDYFNGVATSRLVGNNSGGTGFSQYNAYGANVAVVANDLSDATGFQDGPSGGQNTYYGIIFTGGKSYAVNKVSVRSHPDAGYYLNDFTVYGSNNTTNGADGTWTSLGSVSGSKAQNVTATFSNTTTYKAIRVNVTRWNDGGTSANGFYWVDVRMYADL